MTAPALIGLMWHARTRNRKELNTIGPNFTAFTYYPKVSSTHAGALPPVRKRAKGGGQDTFDT